VSWPGQPSRGSFTVAALSQARVPDGVAAEPPPPARIDGTGSALPLTAALNVREWTPRTNGLPVLGRGRTWDLGPVLGRLHVPAEVIAVHVQRGEEIVDTLNALIGGPTASTSRAVG
jgi:hypothetical protein